MIFFWDIYWTEKEWIHEVMDHIHLGPNQKVNHFRNYYELCRKDNLIKNLKKHKRILEKEGKLDDAAEYNFFPSTFHLPSEYSLFCEEFKKNTNNVWIMKPIGKAQGKGIFLFNKLSQVSQWKSDTRWKPDSPQVENYIVQRYINNPLLIGGKKFDLRIYCLVTSYSPLVAYLYRDGFARFTHHRYDSEDITNTYVHLTNVAIQKTSENYDEKLGGKWDLRTLKLYMMSQFGQEEVNECFANIQRVVIRALQCVQRVIINDKHCFELYGFDVLIDSNLKSWLIEVNGSPSMTANTAHDFELKCNLLDDVFTVLDLEKVLTGQEEQIGGFDLICKGVPVKNESSLFSTMLGSHNNRSQQLKKLAKIIASKLSQQEKQVSKRIQSGKDRDAASTAATDTSISTTKSKTKVASKIPSTLPRTTKPPAPKPNPIGQPSPTHQQPVKDPNVNNNLKTAKATKVGETTKPKTAVGLPSINNPGGPQRVSISNTNNILNQPSYPPKSLTNVAEKIPTAASYRSSIPSKAETIKKTDKIPPKPISRNQENIGLHDKRPSSKSGTKNGRITADEIIGKESISQKQYLQRIKKASEEDEEDEKDQGQDQGQGQRRRLSDEDEEGEEEAEEREDEEDENEEEEEGEDDEGEEENEDDEEDQEQIQPNRRIKKSSEDYE